MTDQKRARAERVVYRAIAEAITAERTADTASKAAAERIDAIYSEGVEPVKMLVAYHNHEIIHLHDWDAEDAKAIATIATVTPLYASPPSGSSDRAYTESLRKQMDAMRATRAHDKLKIEGLKQSESRLRKALEEIAAYDEWYCDVTTGGRMECQACNEAEHTDSCPVTIARRALSDTPESNDNQGGMDDG